MNSAERKKKRYERRKAERERKRIEYKEMYDKFENISSPDALLPAAMAAQNGISWKTSPQRYQMHLVTNVINTSEDLIAGRDVRRGFITFILYERGKLRCITSVHFGERVVQKAFCRNVLVPILSRSLIYDNGACIKDKGYTFAVDRLKKQLRDFYNKYGTNNGYVLLIDLKNFFGSIPHDKLKERIAEKIDDIEVLRLAFDFIDSFQGDNGLGLGSETCQIEAVFYPDPVDHFVKDQLRYDYERYMDDSSIVGKTKEELKVVRDRVIDKYTEHGLTVNKNKTKIVKLDSPEFKFLKNRVKLDDNGKVVIRPDKKSVHRTKEKLRKFKKLYDDGEITFDTVNQSYQSTRGYLERKNAYNIIKQLDVYFKENFVIPERKRRAEENHRKQLEANKGSKRQQKKAKYLEKQKKIQQEIPCIAKESEVDKQLEEKFEDGSIMTSMIGREDTRNYQKQKSKRRKGYRSKYQRKFDDRPGRKRIAQGIREVPPDDRMSYYEVKRLKEKVEENKRKKHEAILKAYDEKAEELRNRS